MKSQARLDLIDVTVTLSATEARIVRDALGSTTENGLHVMGLNGAEIDALRALFHSLDGAIND